MSNIFHEIDEDVRRARYRSLWDRYGLHAVAGVALIVLAVAAINGWGYWQEGRQEESSVVYQQAIEALEEDNSMQTRLQLAETINEVTGGYGVLARFREAAALVNAPLEVEEEEVETETETDESDDSAETDEMEESTVADDADEMEMEEGEDVAAADDADAMEMEESEEAVAVPSESDNIASAVAIYDSLVADSGIGLTLRNLARVRAGLLLVGRANLEILQQRLGGLAESSAPLNRSAREVLAIAAFEAGDYTDAKDSYDALSRDPDAPPGMKDRAATMLDIIEPFIDGSGS